MNCYIKCMLNSEWKTCLHCAEINGHSSAMCSSSVPLTFLKDFNHRMAWGRRDLKDPLVPTYCHEQGCHPLDQLAQGLVQPVLGFGLAAGACWGQGLGQPVSTQLLGQEGQRSLLWSWRQPFRLGCCLEALTCLNSCMRPTHWAGTGQALE